MFLACGNKPKNSMSYDYDKAAAIFTADESFFPILDEELEVFMATAALDSIRPVYTDQEEAIAKLMKNETWLAFATRSLSPKEIQNLKDRQFVPRIIPIAYDGLAIIVNNANPDSCISIKDFKRILSGEVSRWSDAVKKSAEVIDWVEKHENAIGIIGSNWLNDKRDTTNVTFNKNITVMRVSRLDSATVRNSWQPYQYYLYNGNYPLVRTIYALLNEPRSGVPSAFGHFCRLPKGQVIILRAGLLPVQANMNVRDVMVNTK